MSKKPFVNPNVRLKDTIKELRKGIVDLKESETKLKKRVNELEGVISDLHNAANLFQVRSRRIMNARFKTEGAFDFLGKERFNIV